MRRFATPICQHPASARIVAAISMFFILSLGIFGCGDDAGGNGGSSSVSMSINGVNPSPTYAGIETQIAFEISSNSGEVSDNVGWRVQFGDGRSQSGEKPATTITHTYEASGQFPLVAQAVKGDEVIAKASRSLEVLPPVDIGVTGVSGAPANVSAGEQLTASWNLDNAEASPVKTPVDVTVYLSETPDVSAEQLSDITELGSTQITPKGSSGTTVVEGGGTRSAGMTRQIPETLTGGDYHVVAYVDPKGTISDSNPENNLGVSQGIVRVENEAQRAPDVAVTDAVVTPTRSFPTLNQFERGFTITNEGQQDAIGVQVETWVSVGDDVLDEQQDRLVDTSDSFDVTVGDSQTFDPKQIVLDDEIAPEAGQTLEAYVILKAKLPRESLDPNKKNNVTTSNAITVTDERVDGPDINVKSFDVTPTSTFLDGTIQVSMTLANEGNQNAGSFFCGIYMGSSNAVNTDADPRLSNINIAGLETEDSRTIEEAITIPALYEAGEYYFYTVCDPLGALSEPYRSNNQKIHQDKISVTNQADVDLKIRDIGIPPNPTDSKSAEVRATLCVSGSNPTGQSEGELFVSSEGGIDFNNEPVTTFEIPNINPESCKEVPITFEARCIDFQDTFSVGIAVDTANVIPESNEDNNQKIASDPMTVDGKFCQCEEDSFEPNDNKSSAASLTEGTKDLSICDSGSVDYYRVELDKNESLIATTTFPSDRGQLTTELFDPSGLNRIDRSTAEDTQEVARFIAPEPGKYLLKVSAQGNNVRNLYTLKTEILSPKEGLDLLPYGLAVEQSGPYSIGEALDISFTALNLGKSSAEDFGARLYLSPDSNIGDSNDIALNNGNLQLSGISGTQARDESTTASIPTAVTRGDYYLGIELDPSDSLTETSSGNNTAVVGPFSVRTRCYDPFEQNDTFSNSTKIDPGTYFNLAVCSDDQDYYEICADNATTVTAEANFKSDDGDVDLEIYDRTQTVRDRSTTISDTEAVSIPYVNGSQCYTIRTYIQSSGGEPVENDYSLTVDVSDVPPSQRCDGQFENNNSLTSASNLLAALQQTGTLDRCPTSDEDFYYVDLSKNQEVTFTASKDPSTQPGTLRLQLYQPSGVPDRVSETAPGIPTASIENYEAPAAGTYYLEVSFGGSKRDATYSLSAENLGGIDLRASDLEIGPGTYDPGDTLRYGASVENIRADEVGSVEYSLYLGTSSTFEKSSATELVGDKSIGTLSGNTSTSVSGTTTIPGSVNSSASHLHFVVETTGQSEPYTENNTASTRIDIASPTN